MKERQVRDEGQLRIPFSQRRVGTWSKGVTHFMPCSIVETSKVAKASYKVVKELWQDVRGLLGDDLFMKSSRFLLRCFSDLCREAALRPLTLSSRCPHTRNAVLPNRCGLVLSGISEIHRSSSSRTPTKSLTGCPSYISEMPKRWQEQAHLTRIIHGHAAPPDDGLTAPTDEDGDPLERIGFEEDGDVIGGEYALDGLLRRHGGGREVR